VKANAIVKDGAVWFTASGRQCVIDLDDAVTLLGFSLYVASNGYLKAGVRNRSETYVHRILMALCKGDKRQVDHINGNKLDNRRQNLRVVNQTENNCNIAVRKDSTTRVTGVRWDTQRLKWAAQIAFNKKVIPLGRFDSFDEAVAARRAAEDKYHGPYAARHGAQRDQI
jgi:hypothetical protein